MLKRLAILFWAMMGGVSAAQAQVVVLELFTSQGCNTCPPADALLERLADRPDVVALSLHVDYWDYLGWADPFAQSKFTKRQKQYAAAAGQRSIYTPQMVVAGVHKLVGHNADAIASAIGQELGVPSPAKIQISPMSGMLSVKIEPVIPIRASAIVHVVTYDRERVVSVQRGENAGRTLTNVNVTREWMQMGHWDGSPSAFKMPMPSVGSGVAVLVQDGNAGRYLAAAKYEPAR